MWLRKWYKGVNNTHQSVASKRKANVNTVRWKGGRKGVTQVRKRGGGFTDDSVESNIFSLHLYPSVIINSVHKNNVMCAIQKLSVL